ncbi:EamA family transporter [Candidatus Peregrinibacteria bacterium]|nr:EamA family transporter [Candidatus Peregrinibacteria bacterium]
MNWISIVLFAALFHAIANIFDKYIINHEVRDQYLGAFTFGLISFILFSSASIIYGSFSLDPFVIISGIFSGIVYTLGAFLYYKTLQEEEVSRFIPILSFSAVFTMLLGAIILKEEISTVHYIGAILVFSGIIVTALKHLNWDLFKKTSIYLALTAAFLYAIKNILTNVASIENGVFGLTIWIGIGALISSIFLRIFHHHKLTEKIEKKGAHHLIIACLLNVIASLLYTISLAIGPVSLVPFVHKTQIIFVFIFSVMLDMFKPEILEEQISKNILYQKVSAIFLILFGSFLLI